MSSEVPNVNTEGNGCPNLFAALGFLLVGLFLCKNPPSEGGWLQFVLGIGLICFGGMLILEVIFSLIKERRTKKPWLCRFRFHRLSLWKYTKVSSCEQSRTCTRGCGYTETRESHYWEYDSEGDREMRKEETSDFFCKRCEGCRRCGSSIVAEEHNYWGGVRDPFTGRYLDRPRCIYCGKEDEFF